MVIKEPFEFCGGTNEAWDYYYNEDDLLVEVKKDTATVAEYNPGWRTHRAERDVWVPPGGTGVSGRSEKYREMIWETDTLSGLESLGKETRGHRWGQVSKRPRFGAPVRHAPDPHIFAENVCATQDDGEDVLRELVQDSGLAQVGTLTLLEVASCGLAARILDFTGSCKIPNEKESTRMTRINTDEH